MFWLSIAAMTSAGVIPRTCMRAGSSQTRIEYSPAPKAFTPPTPGRRDRLSVMCNWA